MPLKLDEIIVNVATSVPIKEEKKEEMILEKANTLKFDGILEKKETPKPVPKLEPKRKSKSTAVPE